MRSGAVGPSCWRRLSDPRPLPPGLAQHGADPGAVLSPAPEQRLAVGSPASSFQAEMPRLKEAREAGVARDGIQPRAECWCYRLPLGVGPSFAFAIYWLPDLGKVSLNGNRHWGKPRYCLIVF